MEVIEAVKLMLPAISGEGWFFNILILFGLFKIDRRVLKIETKLEGVF